MCRHSPDKVEKQLKDAAYEWLHNWIELDCDVYDVLEALRTGLIQPSIHLCTLLVICECADVCDLHIHNTQHDHVFEWHVLDSQKLVPCCLAQ